MQVITRGWLVGSVGLGVALGLAGCQDACEGTYCAPCTQAHEDVRIAFDLDSAGRGFRQAELRGAYVVRYKRPGFARARDTVRRQLRLASAPSNGFDRYGLSLLELRWPRATAGSYVADTLQVHNYRIVLPAAGRQYELSDLELSSRLATEGCCNCPQNVRRRLLLDGQPVVADGNHGENAAVVLHR